MKAQAVVLTGPADLRDQHWLDERIAAIENGIDAVLDIAVNWVEGRTLARLHPGVSAAEYVKSKVGPLRLGKADVTVLLAETNWSNRQIAAVAGVGHTTVNRAARELDQTVQLERPPTTLGADGKLRPFRPRLDPLPYAYSPIAEGSKEKVRAQKINLTEARGYVRVIENNLAMLQPDEVVPSAYPALRELVPALMAWVQLWNFEDDAEGVK